VKLPVLSGAIMSSDKIHRTLRKSFATLSNNDDWHTLLKRALLLAQANSESERTLGLVKTMLKHLQQFDECCHTLETAIEVPEGMDPEIFLKNLNEEMIDDNVLCTAASRTVRIKATIRGSLGCAQALFDFKTKSAIRSARLKF
jgi:hypothetical protein